MGDHLGQDGEGLVGDDVDAVVAEFFDLFDLAHIGFHVRAVALGALVAEDHIVSGERRAVMKGDAFAQLKAPHGGRGLLPAGGQHGREFEFVIAPNQRLIDVFHHGDLQRLVERMRVHGERVALVGNAQGHGSGGQGHGQGPTSGQGAQAPNRGVGFVVHGVLLEGGDVTGRCFNLRTMNTRVFKGCAGWVCPWCGSKPGGHSKLGPGWRGFTAAKPPRSSWRARPRPGARWRR